MPDEVWPEMTKVLRGAIALMFVCVTLTACGVASREHSPAGNVTAALSRCPLHVRALRRTHASHTHVRAVLPLAPIAAELCVYSTGAVEGSFGRLQWSALLASARARTLTLFLNSGGRGPSCDGGFPVLMRLRYRSASVVSIVAAGCEPELLSTSAGTQALSPTGSLGVGGLLDPPLQRGGRVIRVADYIGHRLAVAARAARRNLKPAGLAHVGLNELNDPNARFGRVVWQTPLPRTRQDATSGSIGLIVAVQHAPTCQADQLLGRFANGGNGTGDHFGNIELLDTSSRACSLGGRLTLHGVGADGRADTKTMSEPVGATLVLSPRATLRILQHAPATALIATFGFAGNARDDPRAPNGICYDHETRPKMWSLTLRSGVTLRFANGAPGEGGPFYSCRGSLFFGLSPGVQLLGT